MTGKAAETAATTPKSAPCTSLKTETEAITAHQAAPTSFRPTPKSR
jgi:hypothetical protein